MAVLARSVVTMNTHCARTHTHSQFLTTCFKNNARGNSSTGCGLTQTAHNGREGVRFLKNCNKVSVPTNGDEQPSACHSVMNFTPRRQLSCYVFIGHIMLQVYRISWYLLLKILLSECTSHYTAKGYPIHRRTIFETTFIIRSEVRFEPMTNRNPEIGYSGTVQCHTVNPSAIPDLHVSATTAFSVADYIG